MAPAGLMRAALAEALWWCERPPGLPAPAHRPAADGERPRRPRARGRGRRRAGLPRGARLRRGRPRLRPPRRGAGQVPQRTRRCPQVDLRGDGMPRRRRLRRGGTDAALLSRGAAELDLGRLGQRHLPRHPALPRPRARGPRPPARRAGRRAQRQRRPTPRNSTPRFAAGPGPSPRRRPAGSPSAWPRFSPRRCSSAAAIPRWPRALSPPASPEAAAASPARCRARWTATGSSRDSPRPKHDARPCGAAKAGDAARAAAAAADSAHCDGISRSIARTFRYNRLGPKRG